MATKNAKIKSIKPYPPKKDGTKSIGITFDDDTFGYYGFSGEHGLKTDVSYFIVYEDKISAKGNPYQDISKINEREEPAETKTTTNQTKSILSSVEIAKLKADGAFIAIKLSINAFTSNTITYDKIFSIAKEIKTYIWDALDELSTQE